MADLRDCSCPKRDPYLCAAHRFDAGDEAVDEDGEEYCLCSCHDEWWEEAVAFVGKDADL